MSVAITTLVENSAGEHKSLMPEHGLSFLVQTQDHTLVFDTGQSDRFMRNAEYLGYALDREVRHVVLSHGHYDHTGGLCHLLAKSKNTITVHVGNGFFVPKYATVGPALEFLGNRFTRQEIEREGHMVSEHPDDIAEVVPDVYIVSNFERTEDTDWCNERFVLIDGDGQRPDAFDDEVSLVIRSCKGLVLLVGCSHPGIMNIVSTVRRRFSESIYAVIGGTHLAEATGTRLQDALVGLSSLDHTLLGVSHCTGASASERLKELSDNCFDNHTGTLLVV